MESLFSLIQSQVRHFPETPTSELIVEATRRTDYVRVRFIQSLNTQVEFRAYCQEEQLMITYNYPYDCRNYIHPQYFVHSDYMMNLSDKFMLKAIVDVSPIWPPEHLESMISNLILPGDVQVDGQRALAADVWGPQPARAPVQEYELNPPAY